MDAVCPRVSSTSETGPSYPVHSLKRRFDIVGYGCSTCVGNTAPLSDAVLGAVKQVRARGLPTGWPLREVARTFTPPQASR